MNNYAQTMEDRGSHGQVASRWISSLLVALALGFTSASGAEIALTWADNSSNESGFKVERATGAGAFAEIGTVGANVTAYVDGNITPGTTYNYRVAAFNSAGDSAYSNTAPVTVPAAANTAPTISNVANQSITQGANTGALAVTIGDAETAAGSLTLSGSSSNLSLVPNANIVVGGFGGNRTVTVTPAAGQTGTATITLTVSDGELSANDTFVLTVSALAPANTAPTISNVANQSITLGANTGALAVTIGDAETAAGSLTLSGSSSNLSLVPNANIVVGGFGANRTVTVTPAAGQTGTATITLTVSDGELSANDTFVLTVNAVAPSNTAPTISNIFSRTITEDSSTGAVNFTINDAETAADALVVTASSSNQSLVPNENIVLGGSGGTRTITVTPAANQSGFSTITVRVSDGELTDTDTFRVTVFAVNDAPTISALGNQTIEQDAATAALGFVIDDVETAAGSLSVTASSSNAVLVPASGIALGGSGANRTITVTPAAGQSGTATITVTVSDGSASGSASFALTVNAGSSNVAPTVTNIDSQAAASGGQVGPIAFAIADSETSAFALAVTASSSNQALVPNANIVLGGFGANRSVTVLAASGQSGSSTITITVSDGTNSTTESFVVSFGTAQAPSSQMLNLSSRVMYRDGQENLIPGFVVAGTENKQVLLRVVGPTLGTAPYNVPGVLPDPQMILQRWNGSAFVDIAANDDWNTNANVAQIRQVSAAVSAFPLVEGSFDAVLLIDLAPGNYTIAADDVNGASGVVIVEIYDAEPENTASSLINMSNRGYVGSGGEVMITGFVVSAEASKTLLVRAVGPGLAVAPYNVPNTISDPVISIFRSNPDGSDTLVLTHDNWSDGPDTAEVAAIAASVSAFPLPAGSKDAAVVVTLDPGVYTVVVSGVNGASGTALVEVYTVD